MSEESLAAAAASSSWIGGKGSRDDGNASGISMSFRRKTTWRERGGVIRVVGEGCRGGWSRVVVARVVGGRERGKAFYHRFSTASEFFNLICILQ